MDVVLYIGLAAAVTRVTRHLVHARNVNRVCTLAERRPCVDVGKLLHEVKPSYDAHLRVPSFLGRDVAGAPPSTRPRH